MKADSELAKQVNATYVITKETERQKYRPGTIVELMHKEGFKRFNMHAHTEFWKAEDAKNPAKGLGVEVEWNWYWYGSKKFAHTANKMRPPTNNNPRPSAALRDALLPKLLSGELRVPQLPN